MIGDRRVLGVVLARSGSRGIPDKNMRVVGGKTLIARAGDVLRECTTVDAALISTDSERYAEEGRRHALDAWFLRPPELSSDSATAVDSTLHALLEAERHYGHAFDVVLIVEPTSPCRRAADVDACVRILVEADADSVVTVSRADAKYHPRKLLKIEGQKLTFFEEDGAAVTARQQLDDVYFRNGVCYALRRSLLVDERRIFSAKTLPLVIERPVVNIDEPIELVLAEHLLRSE